VGQEVNANNPVNLVDKSDNNRGKFSAHIDGMSDGNGEDNDVGQDAGKDKDADAG
jgi:hypothetical protein